MRQFTLKYPVTIGSEEIKTVDLPDRLKGKHLRAIDGVDGEVSKGLAIISYASGHPMSVVESMDAEDLMPMMDYISGFLV